MKRDFKRILGVSLVAVIATNVYAAGFKLEQSPSILADGGDAAVVEDAGTNWYNSAGNVLLPQQLALGSIWVYQPTKFSGTAIAPSIITPGLPGTTFAASGRASSYNNVPLPSIHYVYPFACNRFALGLSILPAWGLLEDYGHNSIVRYDLDRVYTRTIMISPSFSMKINDCISIGVGPDIHYWYLSSKLYVRTFPLTPGDAVSRLSTDDWAYGYHAGILVKLDNATRIGFNYRSKITMKMEGYSDFAFNFGLPAFETNLFSLTIPMPPTSTLSIYRDITPCWALMGSVIFDQWSVIKSFHGKNFISPTGTLSNVNVPQNYRNTWDFTVGTHIKLNEQILLRSAIKYEQTPTQAAHRDINFPDGDKLGLNFGARYQVSKKLAVDVLYTHVFVRGGTVNQTNVFGANVNGRVHSSIDLFGTQLVWSIC